ncbi:hypothetical protein Hdeb2414_s0027g00692991 [Helianthus debilis subsp. tardiflorus]
MIRTSNAFCTVTKKEKSATVGHSSTRHVVKEIVFCTTDVTNMLSVSNLSFNYNTCTNLDTNSWL